MILYKTCGRCGRKKKRTEFYVVKKHRDGLSSYCKACQIDTAWERNLRTKYGIGAEDYARMMEAQGGTCAICLEECSSGNRLAVDHCHDTGKVRGLLCIGCNTAIAKLKERRELFLAAMRYLGI